MTFNSFSYFLFLPIVYLVFYFTPDRRRWLVLLAASYGFYATFQAPYLLGVLFLTTAISYLCGKKIATRQDEQSRKHWLWVGTLSCVGILSLVKYFPFLAAGAGSLFGPNFTTSAAVIGIGVSYFCFQAISYLADIYLEIVEPESHFGRYALYLAFFPKLLQGPIERGGDLLPQLKKPYRFDYNGMRSGMFLFTWGLVKKLVLADRLSLYADQVYNNLHDYSGVSLMLGTYAYALQIYFDFSGYTDMARGTARIFGIDLTENFNAPYLATSIADFWRRWHISFSRWILDYIFKPLQMGWRNAGRAGTAFALIVTFLVSGIWHGATWGFVVWGLLHGIYLTCSTYYRPYQKKLHKWLGIEKSRWLTWWQVLVTFNLVSFAWIFFRSRSLADARYIISHFFYRGDRLDTLLFSHGKTELHLTIVALVLYLVSTVYFKGKTLDDLYLRNPLARFMAYQFLLLIIFLLASYSAGKSFIYFQF